MGGHPVLGLPAAEHSRTRPDQNLMERGVLVLSVGGCMFIFLWIDGNRWISWSLGIMNRMVLSGYRIKMMGRCFPTCINMEIFSWLERGHAS
jgi:hypothetical protein